MTLANSKAVLRPKVCICTCRQMLKDGKTCQVSTNDDDSELDDYRCRAVVRCQLSLTKDAPQIWEYDVLTRYDFKSG